MEIKRQGDVLLIKTDKTSIPADATLVALHQGFVPLAFGETTGHVHALPAKTSTLYEWQGGRLLEITQRTQLKHGSLPAQADPDHLPIDLEPGIYEVRQQRQY